MRDFIYVVSLSRHSIACWWPLVSRSFFFVISFWIAIVKCICWRQRYSWNRRSSAIIYSSIILILCCVYLNVLNMICSALYRLNINFKICMLGKYICEVLCIRSRTVHIVRTNELPQGLGIWFVFIVVFIHSQLRLGNFDLILKLFHFGAVDLIDILLSPIWCVYFSICMGTTCLWSFS